MIIKVFSSISDSKSFSRSSLIEQAIDKFLLESVQYLQKAKDIDVKRLLEEELPNKFDTVILSSTGRGFEETFLDENESPCWCPCRISDEGECGLHYIAIYRGHPISAITHYAKIKEFKHDTSRDCKVCYFDGNPIELPNKITLGSKNTCYFIGTKYTSPKSLLNATRADEVAFR